MYRQTVFDHVNWTKLMQILQNNGINWHERKLISKLYTDQSVTVWLDQGEARRVQTGTGYKTRMLFVTYCIELT
jgi:hypothetical protein